MHHFPNNSHPSSPLAPDVPPAPAGAILVVDDEAEVRTCVTRILSHFGFAVLTAAQGREALRLYEQQRVDLMITDIVMPDAEGLELIRQVRRRAPTLPILAMSGAGALGPDEYLGIARLLGANRTLPKPFDGEFLVRVVREMLMPPEPFSQCA